MIRELDAGLEGGTCAGDDRTVELQYSRWAVRARDETRPTICFTGTGDPFGHSCLCRCHALARRELAARVCSHGSSPVTHEHGAHVCGLVSLLRDNASRNEDDVAYKGISN